MVPPPKDRASEISVPYVPSLSTSGPVHASAATHHLKFEAWELLEWLNGLGSRPVTQSHVVDAAVLQGIRGEEPELDRLPLLEVVEEVIWQILRGIEARVDLGQDEVLGVCDCDEPELLFDANMSCFEHRHEVVPPPDLRCV